MRTKANGTATTLNNLSDFMLRIITDLDDVTLCLLLFLMRSRLRGRALEQLFATNENYLLGTWVEAARSWGATSDAKAQMQFNALNLVTLVRPLHLCSTSFLRSTNDAPCAQWGPSGEINDYSARAWQGLYGDYYRQRWALFFDRVVRQSSGTFLIRSA